MIAVIIALLATLAVPLLLDAIKEGTPLKRKLLTNESKRIFCYFLLIPLAIVTFSHFLLLLKTAGEHVAIFLICAASAFTLWKCWKSFNRLINFVEDIGVLLIPHIKTNSKQKDADQIKNMYEDAFKELDDMQPETREEFVNLFIKHVDEEIQRGQLDRAAKIAESCSQYTEEGLRFTEKLFRKLLEWRRADLEKFMLLSYPTNKCMDRLLERPNKYFVLFRSLDDLTQKIKKDAEKSNDGLIPRKTDEVLLENVAKKIFGSLLPKLMKAEVVETWDLLYKFPESWRITPENLNDAIPSLLFHSFYEQILRHCQNVETDMGYPASNVGHLAEEVFPGIDQDMDRMYLSLFFKMTNPLVFFKTNPDTHLQKILEDERPLFWNLSSLQTIKSPENKKRKEEARERTIDLIHKILTLGILQGIQLPGDSNSLASDKINLKNGLEIFKERVKGYKSEGGRDPRNREAILELLDGLLKRLEERG